MTDKKWVIHRLLDDMGFSISQLAQAIGYPVAALRAFRSGDLDRDEVTFDDIRAKLHDIGTMTSRLGQHRGKIGGNREEAALFETSVLEGYTAIGWDLYHYPDGESCAYACRGLQPGRKARERGVIAAHNGLCALAAGDNPEQVLDRFIPDWRTRFWTDYEITPDEDGELLIRHKR